MGGGEANDYVTGIKRALQKNPALLSSKTAPFNTFLTKFKGAGANTVAKVDAAQAYLSALQRDPSPEAKLALEFLQHFQRISSQGDAKMSITNLAIAGTEIIYALLPPSKPSSNPAAAAATVLLETPSLQEFMAALITHAPALNATATKKEGGIKTRKAYKVKREPSEQFEILITSGASLTAQGISAPFAAEPEGSKGDKAQMQKYYLECAKRLVRIKSGASTEQAEPKQAGPPLISGYKIKTREASAIKVEAIKKVIAGLKEAYVAAEDGATMPSLATIMQKVANEITPRVLNIKGGDKKLKAALEGKGTPSGAASKKESTVALLADLRATMGERPPVPKVAPKKFL